MRKQIQKYVHNEYDACVIGSVFLSNVFSLEACVNNTPGRKNLATDAVVSSSCGFELFINIYIISIGSAALSIWCWQ